MVPMKNATKVLIADDDPTFLLLLRSTLQRIGMPVVEASNGVEALNIFNSDDPPRLAILDWLMPGLNGMDLIAKIRSMKDLPYVYILVLTSKEDVSDLVTALDAGADDFLSKPFQPEELISRLNVGQRIIHLEQKLSYLASYDPLTEVLNKKTILARFAAELHRSSRNTSPIGLIHLSIDDFKKINEKFDFTTADSLLKFVASLVKDQLRPYDELGRFDSNSFLLVLPSTNIEETELVAQRILQKIHKTPFILNNNSIKISFSIGVTALEEQFETALLEEYIKTADKALYLAQNLGKNRVEFLHPPLV